MIIKASPSEYQIGSTVWKALEMDPHLADPNLAENAWMQTGQKVDDQDILVKRPKDPKHVYKWIASSEAVDYDEEVIQLAAWRLKHYRKKGVILWAHGHSELPIAKARRIRAAKDVGQLQIWGEFFPHDVYWWADQVERVLAWGGLPDGSVGFKYYKGERGDTEKGEPRFTFTDVELLEFSVCPVGANPEAMVQLSKGFSSAEDARRKIWAGFTPETYPRKIIVPPGEKIEDHFKAMWAEKIPLARYGIIDHLAEEEIKAALLLESLPIEDQKAVAKITKDLEAEMDPSLKRIEVRQKLILKTIIQDIIPRLPKQDRRSDGAEPLKSEPDPDRVGKDSDGEMEKINRVVQGSLTEPESPKPGRSDPLLRALKSE